MNNTHSHHGRLDRIVRDFEKREALLKREREEESERRDRTLEAARTCLKTIVTPALERTCQDIVARPRFYSRVHSHLDSTRNPSVTFDFLLGQLGDCRFSATLRASYDDKNERITFTTEFDHASAGKDTPESFGAAEIDSQFVEAKVEHFIKSTLDTWLERSKG